jgi:RHS repeat-associated protein
MRQIWRYAKWIVVAALLLGAQGTLAAVSTRTSAFDYDAATGLLTKEILEPDSSTYCLVTAYTLDGYGNKVAVTKRNCNGSAGSLPGTNSEAAAPSGDPVFATRADTKVMDARGQFAIEDRNALYNSATNPHQHEIKAYNDNFGTVATATGPNDLTTAWYYDGFGRKTLEVRPDGNGSQWTYLLCSGFNGGSAACPSINAVAAIYVVVATPVAGPINSAADTTGPVNGPVVKTYYDTLDRVIRTETQGFDGSGASTPIYQDIEYDNLGRVTRKSRPYFEGQATYWISYGYDAIGRVTTETQPDTTTTTTTYNGLTVTVTNANSQTRSTVSNSQGEVVSVIDANGKALTFQYDPFGNTTSTTDDLGNQTVLTYDPRGRKIQIADPDMGTWTYAYDAMAQMIRQVNAKNQTSTMAYDPLGRMTSHTEPDLVSNWYYDAYAGGATCSMGIGKLCQVTTSTGYSRTNTYDSLGRAGATATTIDTPTPYVESVTYDSNGRLATRALPSGLVLKYVFTTLGFLQQITDNSTGALYWEANSIDAEGHVVTQTHGNGVVTQQGFDPNTGRITSILAGSGNAVENLSYHYDNIGNMLTRSDGNQNLTETFTYDALNRLKTTQVSSPGAGVLNGTYGYDDIGDMTLEDDGSTVSYPPSGAGSVRPHAAVQVTMSAGNYVSYGYDANGNQTTQTTTTNGVVDHTKDRTFVYTSFNMPLSLVAPSVTETYTYGPEHQRTRLTSSLRGTTVYVNPRTAGELSYERDIHLNGSIEQRSFITAYGVVVAEVKATTASGATTTAVLCLHRDNLGSTAAITDATSAVIERLAYGPFGKRRFPNGASDPTNSLVGVNTDRGFTNHEMLDELTLVHMNGRVYDPVLKRFLSADPTVPDPHNMQSYNRYTYVLNNPLILTDPSGYFSLGSWFASLWRHVWHNQFARMAIEIGVGFETGIMVSGWVQEAMEEAAGACFASITAEAAAAGGAAGGFAGAFVGSGGNFKQGVIGGLEGAANGFIGGYFKVYGENVAAHAALGCASAMAQGSSCGSGAMAGGFSAAAAPLVGATTSFLGRGTAGAVGGALVEGVIGGTASVLGGGKFANGAQTAAFQYVYNCFAHDCNGADYSSDKPNYHEFLYAVDMCLSGDPDCLAFARETLSCNSAPGQPACVTPGAPDVRARLLGGNPVTQYMPNADIIINGTDPSHWLSDGYSVRWIGVSEQGVVQIWTFGIGNNTNPGFRLFNYFASLNFPTFDTAAARAYTFTKHPNLILDPGIGY